jgi:hypothetical protein
MKFQVLTAASVQMVVFRDVSELLAASIIRAMKIAIMIGSKHL